MKVNKWTLGLAAVGLVTLPAGVQADEAMTPVMTSLTSTTISGYVNTSAHWDIGTGNDSSPNYAFNRGKQDGFNLDVVKLSIARPLDEANWSAGYQVDLLFGPDANSLATQSTLSDGAGDFGIQQAYVALRAPVGHGLDFKVGVWDTIIGYEVFDAGNNPNYTRSYGYTMEPTTHTGVLASYQFTDWLSAAVGIANTYGPQINDRAFVQGDKAESYKAYLASIALTAPESMGFLAGSTLYAGVVNGFNSGIGDNETSWYIGATMATPVEGLRIGVSYDYAGAHHEVNNGSYPDEYANAVAGYLSYQLTEKMSVHGRAEYATYSPKSVNPPAAGGYSTIDDGLPEKVFALTGTLQYDLWKNVLSRLEIRWDHQLSGVSNGRGEAFGGQWINYGGGVTLRGTEKNSLLIAANIIYKF
jgi:Putative beta-barrel porin-2, OmpL-like. bbp2